MRVIAATVLGLALACSYAAAQELAPVDTSSSPVPGQGDAQGSDVQVQKTTPPEAPPPPPPPTNRVPPPKDAVGCIAGPEVAVDPATAPLHLGTQTYRQTLNLCDHHIVLTFDDGPSPETTPLVLKALRDAGVRANFFLIGRHACRYPVLARREHEDGHVVGHHSNTHPSFTLRGFDERSAERDIANGIAADEAAIYGKDADATRPHVPFFRFPGFADSTALLSHLNEHHVAVFGSDLWAGDWIAMSPEHERRRILELLEKRPHHNGIILFHDTKMSTARMLPDLLRELKARGYRFVQITYRADAPAPKLVDGPPGMPLTERVISGLRKPIVPGQHQLEPGSGPGCDGAPAVIGEETQP